MSGKEASCLEREFGTSIEWNAQLPEQLPAIVDLLIHANLYVISYGNDLRFIQSLGRATALRKAVCFAR